MALISAPDADVIRQHFEKELTGDVTIQFFTEPISRLMVPGRRECEYCEETKNLLEEVSVLSDKLHLDVHDVKADPESAEPFGVERVPAIVLQGAARGKVRFFGIPSGYEFSSLIQDIVATSTGTTKLSENARQELAELPNDVHIQVFVTPT